MLRDSTVVVVVAVVRTRPRAIPLSMITMKKSIHGFGYGAPLGDPWGRRSSAITVIFLVINLKTQLRPTLSSKHFPKAIRRIELYKGSLSLLKALHPSKAN